MTQEVMDNLGPLAALAGIWEGDKGDDTAPSDDRGTEKNLFRERMTFEPIGPVDNHEQKLYGLRYSTVAFRLGEGAVFHEELGYWLWDAKAKQVMRCFLVPRGIAVIAGGTVEPGGRRSTLSPRSARTPTASARTSSWTGSSRPSGTSSRSRSTTRTASATTRTPSSG